METELKEGYLQIQVQGSFIQRLFKLDREQECLSYEPTVHYF